MFKKVLKSNYMADFKLLVFADKFMYSLKCLKIQNKVNLKAFVLKINCLKNCLKCLYL